MTSKNKKNKKGNKQVKSISKKKLQHVLPMLDTLKKVSSKQRPILLSHFDDASCSAIYETVHNVIHNPKVNSKCQKRLKKSLYPYKKDLRYLANKKHSNKSKKKRLIRMGGFPIGAVLSAAIPLLLNLLTK